VLERWGRQPGRARASGRQLRRFAQPACQPRWQRVIIAARAHHEVVLAIAILTGLYMFKYQKISDEDCTP